MCYITFAFNSWDYIKISIKLKINLVQWKKRMRQIKIKNSKHSWSISTVLSTNINLLFWLISSPKWATMTSIILTIILFITTFFLQATVTPSKSVWLFPSTCCLKTTSPTLSIAINLTLPTNKILIPIILMNLSNKTLDQSF